MPQPTYSDIVEYLITASFGGPQDAEQRDIRTAVQRAYQELTTMRDWSYYHAHGRIITPAPYTAGSISVSGTDVTLYGGAWPAWSESGAYIRANNEIVRIASRTSDSVLVTDPNICFKAPLSNQSYALYRTVYPLPSDFRNLDEPSDEYNWWAGHYITPDEAMKLERVSNSSGEPYHWTVIKNPQANSFGWALKLIGPPTQQETIDFTYRRSATPLVNFTDKIDIPEHMHNAMYSAAEYWLARIRKHKAEEAYALYQRDLRLAMEQDQLAPLSGRSQEIWHDGGWKSPLNADRGT